MRRKGLWVGFWGRGEFILHKVFQTAPTNEADIWADLWVEHAVKWYQDKIRKVLIDHAALETKEGKNIDYSIPEEQSEYQETDDLCKMLGPEFEW